MGVIVEVSVIVGVGGMKRVDVEVGVADSVGVNVAGISVVGWSVLVGVGLVKVAVPVASIGALWMAINPAQ